MKLLASDFDGTFFINEEGLKINIVESNKFIENNLFIIATGRTYYDITKEIDKYNIKCSYLIIDHGASILKDDEIIYSSTINNDIKNKLIKDLKIDKSKRLVCSSKKESRVDITHKDLTKIYISYDKKYLAKIITLIINIKYKKYINIISYKNTIEIVEKNVDKKNAIEYVRKKENIEKGNVITIGDNINDIQMIKEFNGFAMENATYKVKKNATKTYKTIKDLLIDIKNNNI